MQSQLCQYDQQTSEANMVAQVPIHQHTTGLVILPSLMPWQILYSSVPPIWVVRPREAVKYIWNTAKMLKIKVNEKQKH